MTETLNRIITDIVNTIGHENAIRIKALITATGYITLGTILGILISCWVVKYARTDTSMKEFFTVKVSQGKQRILYVNTPRTIGALIYTMVLCVLTLLFHCEKFDYTRNEQEKLIKRAKRATWIVSALVVFIILAGFFTSSTLILHDVDGVGYRLDSIFDHFTEKRREQPR